MRERNIPNIPLNEDFKSMGRYTVAVSFVGGAIFVAGCFELINGEDASDKIFQGTALVGLGSLLGGVAQVMRLLQTQALNLRQWQILEGKVEE